MRVRTRDVIICSVLLLGFITLFKMLKFSRDEDREKALAALNLKLTGIVEGVDKFKNHPGAGVIAVKVISSNVRYYDPRNELKYYYCIINKDHAELYDNGGFDINIGDSVKVDTKENRFYRKPPHRHWSATPLTLNTSDSFYTYIRKYHQKILTN